MNKIYLLAVFGLLIGCGEKDPSEEIMKEISDSQKLFRDKDLTTKLTNKDTVAVADALELRDKCDEIMSFIGTGDIDAGFEEIKKYTFLPASEMDNACIATKKQLDLTKNRFGDFVGHEFVCQQLVSDSLVRFIYLAKCENHPLVWRFIFYKSDDKWTLNNFYWDDQIQNIK